MIKNYNFSKFFLLLLVSSIMLLTACSTNIREEHLTKESAYRQIDAKTAAENALYAMMSTDVYHDSDLTPFPLKTLGWRLVDLEGNKTDNATFDEGCLFGGTGLAYDIYKQIDSKKVIFVFRGTDDNWCDFFMANTAILYSLQYEKAFKKISKYLEDHPSKDLKDIVVTGHSLGGGLAIAISIRFGIDAIVFDSSPVINSLFISGIKKAKRILIYQKGEFLSVFRQGSGFSNLSEFEDAIPKGNIYVTNFNFGEMNAHASRPLAMHLLKLGSTESAELKSLCEAISCSGEK